MYRKKNSPIFFNPFMIWSDLAVKTGEMMLASSQVIRHRTQRMAAGGATPDPRDQREFQLMGQEKIEAMMESVQAMGLQMFAPSMGLKALDLAMKSSAAMMSLAASTNFTQVVDRQAKAARAARNSANINSMLSESAAKIAHAGLKPIHSRATRNAKRLTKT